MSFWPEFWRAFFRGSASLQDSYERKEMRVQMPTPSVGRDVHYVARGSADGVFPPVCRAAKMTEVLDEQEGVVSLCVFNPSGLFFDRDLHHHFGRWPEDDEFDSKQLCGGRIYPPGTWHWPERVGE